MALKIDSRNVAMTPRWKAEIEERMADLQAGHDNIIHGRVTLTKNRHHKQDQQIAEALVVAILSHRHIITARKDAKTFEEAIRTAFLAIEVELQKYREKRAMHGRGSSRQDQKSVESSKVAMSLGDERRARGLVWPTSRVSTI